MKRFLSILVISNIIFMYVTHKIYQYKKGIAMELNQSERMIQFQNNELNRYKKVNEEILIAKLKAENKSIKLSEKLNDVLKNNKCNNELIPADADHRLYKRAYQIRQSAGNSD